MSLANCHLCNRALNVPDLDEFTMMSMAKEAEKSNRSSRALYRELKNTKFKYICDDCTKTKEYWKWAKTDEARGHAAVTAECNI